MSSLKTESNIPDPDGFYEELLKLHEGLDESESHSLNARLILILANHIGDREVISQAMQVSKLESTDISLD